MRAPFVCVFVVSLVSCTAAPPSVASPAPAASDAPSPSVAAAALAPLMTPAIADAAPRVPSYPTIGPEYRTQTVAADFDCDGAADQLTATHDGAPSSNRWHVVLALASGTVARADIAAFPLTSVIAGTPDVDLDGCADAVLRTGNGASTVWLSFLTYHAGALHEATSGDPSGTFLIGGSVRHGDSIDCRGDAYGAEVVWRSVSSYSDELQWDVTERVYRWSVPGTLALAYVTRTTIHVAHPYEQPPDHERLWGFNCGALKG